MGMNYARLPIIIIFIIVPGTHSKPFAKIIVEERYMHGHICVYFCEYKLITASKCKDWWISSPQFCVSILSTKAKSSNLWREKQASNPADSFWQL